jgi:hypothetical protein
MYQKIETYVRSIEDMCAIGNLERHKSKRDVCLLQSTNNIYAVVIIH